MLACVGPRKWEHLDSRLDLRMFCQTSFWKNLQGIFCYFHQSQNHISPSLTGSLVVFFVCFFLESSLELISPLLNIVCFYVPIVTMEIDQSHPDNVKHRHWHISQNISPYQVGPSLHGFRWRLLTKLPTWLGVFAGRGNILEVMTEWCSFSRLCKHFSLSVICSSLGPLLLLMIRNSPERLLGLFVFAPRAHTHTHRLISRAEPGVLYRYCKIENTWTCRDVDWSFLFDCVLAFFLFLCSSPFLPLPVFASAWRPQISCERASVRENRGVAESDRA